MEIFFEIDYIRSIRGVPSSPSSPSQPLPPPQVDVETGTPTARPQSQLVWSSTQERRDSFRTPTRSSNLSSERAPTDRGECPICLQDAPLRVTTCGHGYCESCLQQYIQSQPSNVGSIVCPVCRQPLAPEDVPRGFVPQGLPVVRTRTTTRLNAGQRRALKYMVITSFSTAILLTLFMSFARGLGAGGGALPQDGRR